MASTQPAGDGGTSGNDALLIELQQEKLDAMKDLERANKEHSAIRAEIGRLTDVLKKETAEEHRKQLEADVRSEKNHVAAAQVDVTDARKRCVSSFCHLPRPYWLWIVSLRSSLSPSLFLFFCLRDCPFPAPSPTV